MAFNKQSLTRWLLLVAVLALVLAVAALAGCGSSDEPAAEASPAESPTVDMVAVVDDYMAAWCAHDPAKAATYLAEDATYIDATVGTPVEGRAACESDVIANFINAAPDCVWKMDGEPVVDDADLSIAYQWTFTGTNTGDWADGTKASGKSFEFSGLTLMRFNEAGEITYQADYYDALNFYKQLGWAALWAPLKAA